MAVSTTDAFSGPYITNGVTIAFPFTFKAPSTAEVSVLLRDAEGVELTPPAFSVLLGVDAGGTVTFVSPPVAGNSLLILLDPFFTQDLEFENGSAWLAEPVNEGYDRSALRDQVLRRDVQRGILAPIGESGLQLPPAAGRKGKFLGFSGVDASPIATEGTSGDDILRPDLASPAPGKGAELVAKPSGGTMADAAAITDQFDLVSSALETITPFKIGLSGPLQASWGGGFENNTHFCIGSRMGRAAGVFWTRSSDNPTVGDMGCYATGMFVIHDSNKFAYCWYGEGRRYAGAGALHGYEVAIINFGDTVDTDPYNPYAANLTDVSRLSTGRGDTPTQTNISAFQHAVSVGGAKALKGWVLGADALVTTGGQGDALNLATTHAVQWWMGPGLRGPRIRSDASANPMAIIFANNQVAFQNSAFATVTTIDPTRLTVAGMIKTGIYTVGTLPAGTKGDRAFVTDAQGGAWLSVVAGGGTINAPVIHNGTNWCLGG